MKKLLTSAAVCGLVFAAAPAHAELDLEIGGYFKGYAFYTSQDDDSAAAAADSRNYDIVRNTEVHLTGESTLDNGLTVGFHSEMEADGNSADGFEVQESYAYFSGGWGRVNFGAEDGAAYLLQVAAPSADSNVDGIRQYVNGVNFANVQDGAIGGESIATVFNVNGARGGIDYDQDLSGYADKLTYLSPIMNGFQLGLSYTPDTADVSDEDALNEDNAAGTLGAAWDGAFRYEGMFNNVGVNFGAGYSKVDMESADTAIADGDDTDDRAAWNVGLDLDISAFGLGVAYLNDDYGDEATTALGTTHHDDEKTWVVGVDYTTGPFKLGASYMDIENIGAVDGTVDSAGVEQGVDAQRYTGGVVYTYGPGMTFNGSISHLSLDNVTDVTGGTGVDATTVMLGTQINF